MAKATNYPKYASDLLLYGKLLATLFYLVQQLPIHGLALFLDKQ